MIIVNTGDLFPGHGTVSRFSGARMWVRNARTRGAFYKSPHCSRGERSATPLSLAPLFLLSSCLEAKGL